jgi:hypothetical protein
MVATHALAVTGPIPGAVASRVGTQELARVGSRTASSARTWRRTIGVRLACIQQRPRIALIGLRAPGPIGMHRRVVRVRDDHLVAERLQVARHPLALRARLQENAGAGPASQHGREPLPARDNASLRDRSILRFDRQLTLALVQIQAYNVHGGRPPGMRPVVRR